MHNSDLLTRIAGNENDNATAVWRKNPENAGNYYDIWRSSLDTATGTFMPPELVAVWEYFPEGRIGSNRYVPN